MMDNSADPKSLVLIVEDDPALRALTVGVIDVQSMLQ
jgi:hypothetical protein